MHVQGFVKEQTICSYKHTLDSVHVVHATVKPVLNSHSKIDKTKVNPNGSLMKVESIAECSKRAFCNAFDLH